MILIILLVLIIGITYEIINLIRIGTIDNPVAFGFLKSAIFMSLILLKKWKKLFKFGIIKKDQKNYTSNYWLLLKY